jgi:hypothetical protein
LEYYSQHYKKEDWAPNYYKEHNQFDKEEDLFKFPFKTGYNQNNISHIATDRIQVFTHKSPPKNLKRQINPSTDHYTTLGFKEAIKPEKKLLITNKNCKKSILKFYRYKKSDIMQIQIGATRTGSSLCFSIICGNPIKEKNLTHLKKRKDTARNTVYNSKTA